MKRVEYGTKNATLRHLQYLIRAKTAAFTKWSKGKISPVEDAFNFDLKKSSKKFFKPIPFINISFKSY